MFKTKTKRFDTMNDAMAYAADTHKRGGTIIDCKEDHIELTYLSWPAWQLRRIKVAYRTWKVN